MLAVSGAKAERTTDATHDQSYGSLDQLAIADPAAHAEFLALLLASFALGPVNLEDAMEPLLPSS